VRRNVSAATQSRGRPQPSTATPRGGDGRAQAEIRIEMLLEQDQPIGAMNFPDIDMKDLSQLLWQALEKKRKAIFQSEENTR
jgi:hypothetical protein